MLPPGRTETQVPHRHDTRLPAFLLGTSWPLWTGGCRVAEFLGLFVKSLPEMESGGSNVCAVGTPHSQGEAGPGVLYPRREGCIRTRVGSDAK